MRILDRYLFFAVARATAVVLLILLALSGFINLIDQLQDVGKGRFQTSDAIFVVVMQWPSHAFQLYPLAVLLGAMLGLGVLAKRSELIVIRAAGVSIARLAGTMFVTGLVLACVGAVIGELMAPPAERFANDYKRVLEEDEPGVSRMAGTWLRDGPRIMNVLQVQGSDQLAGIYTFEFDQSGQLLTIGRSPAARLVGSGRWELDEYVATRVDGELATIERVDSRVLETDIGSEVLETSIVDPDRLSTPNLLEYVSYLRANALESTSYEMALWSRWANPPAVICMVILALPFVFGPLRSGGNGLRLVIGMLIGVVYYLASGSLASSAQVYDISPLLTAWAPVGFLAIAAGVGLLTVR
jgi:lipopolysaccharide export system permease protein